MNCSKLSKRHCPVERRAEPESFHRRTAGGDWRKTLTCEGLNSYLRTTLTTGRIDISRGSGIARVHKLTCYLLAAKLIDSFVDIRESTVTHLFNKLEALETLYDGPINCELTNDSSKDKPCRQASVPSVLAPHGQSAQLPSGNPERPSVQ